MTPVRAFGPLSLACLEDTKALAKRLAPALALRDVVLLEGNLGVGKTAFARFVLEALGVAGDIPSPTFTLVQLYDVPAGPAFHFDLYRLKTPEEIEEIGFEEACGEGIVLVEWPEKARAYMPREALTLRFEMAENNGGRLVHFSASPAWENRLEGLLDAN